MCIYMYRYVYIYVYTHANKSKTTKIPKPSQILLQTQQPNCIHIYRHILRNPNKNIKIIPQEEAHHSAEESSAVQLRYL